MLVSSIWVDLIDESVQLSPHIQNALEIIGLWFIKSDEIIFERHAPAFNEFSFEINDSKQSNST